MQVDCYGRSQTINQNQNEALEALTTSEKLLAEKYKRVVTGGKLTRPVTILFPEILQSYVTALLEIRPKFVPESNKYLFAYPGIADNWLKADVIMRKLAKQSNVENPELLTSNRLRKQIATVMQLLNLSPEENRNLCTFMNHTEKTHKEFYELPQDIFQTAKISKLLILMDQGKAGEFKGKSLNEIQIDRNTDEVIEDLNEEDGDVLNTIQNISENSVGTVEDKIEEPLEKMNSNNEPAQEEVNRKGKTESRGENLKISRKIRLKEYFRNEFVGTRTKKNSPRSF